MTEDLAKHGLYFDYLYNLRVLDPNIASETSDLKEKSGEYIDSKNSVLVLLFFFIHILDEKLNSLSLPLAQSCKSLEKSLMNSLVLRRRLLVMLSKKRVMRLLLKIY